MSHQLSRVGLTLGGFGAFGVAGYVGYTFSFRPVEVAEAPSEEERRKIFDSLGKKWDSRVGFDESITGINHWRRQLVANATGDVLEVAAGSARNLYYYPEHDVKELTMLDFSWQMLEVAVEKKKKLKKQKFPLRFRLGSASNLNYEDGTFDTVVDTFGICSFENPEEALKEMARVLKPGGKMLLMEHGRSDSIWFQKFLERTAESHVHRYGCYCDREILKLVEEAADRFGLTVKETRRKHFGTTYYIILEKS